MSKLSTWWRGIVNAIKSAFTWTRQKPEQKPEPKPEAEVEVEVEQKCTCDLSKPIRAVPDFCLLKDAGENETTLQGNPDIRFLIGNRAHDDEWVFFGQFATRNKLYSFKDGTVFGYCERIDGVDFHCCGQRQAKSASAMLPNEPTPYKPTHRVYWEPH